MRTNKRNLNIIYEPLPWIPHPTFWAGGPPEDIKITHMQKKHFQITLFLSNSFWVPKNQPTHNQEQVQIPTKTRSEQKSKIITQCIDFGFKMTPSNDSHNVLKVDPEGHCGAKLDPQRRKWRSGAPPDTIDITIGTKLGRILDAHRLCRNFVAYILENKQINKKEDHVRFFFISARILILLVIVSRTDHRAHNPWKHTFCKRQTSIFTNRPFSIRSSFR